MGDDDELGLLGQAAQCLREAVDVGLVERGIDLVEHAERHRPHLEHRQQQADRGQGSLATREHRQWLALLARRPGVDLDAGRRQVLGRRQAELGVAAAEELLEASRERILERGEGRAGTGRVISALSEAISSRVEVIADLQVDALRFHALEPLAQLGVFLDRERVAGAKIVEAASQRAQAVGARRLRRLLGRRLPPDIDDRRQQDFVRVGLRVAIGLVVRIDTAARHHIGETTSPAPAGLLQAESQQPVLADAGQLDKELLTDLLQLQPRLHLGDLGLARLLLGDTQALARVGGRSFGFDQPRPIIRAGIEHDLELRRRLLGIEFGRAEL